MAGKANPAPPTDEWDVKIKNKKSFTKPLDKHQILWYNKDVPRGSGEIDTHPLQWERNAYLLTETE